MRLRRRELFPGVFLSTIESNKFKSDCLSLNLLAPLERETISKNALLPRVLARGTMFHPDMDSLNAAMEELYGAQILPIVRKKGEMLALGFYAGFLSGSYVPDKSPLLERVCALLGELLLSPATRGGLLLRDYVDSEKEKLIDDIRAKLNDKRSYAPARAVELMCACEPYGCDDMGDEAGAEAVGYVDLTRHYRDLLQSCPIELFYCGSARTEKVAQALHDALITLPRGRLNEDLGTDVRMNALEDRPREFHERLDVGQGKLCLGFRLGQCMEDPDLPAILVFNTLYGGSVNSRLFRSVREERSLCYYIDSVCDRMKGVMLVSSGVDFADFQAAKAEILAQLDSLARGEITDEELRSAKNTAVSALRGVMDSPAALENYYLFQTLCGLAYGPEEDAALSDEVTREDVQAIAQSVELDAVYYLEADEEAEEEGEATDDAAL
ncbi:MAG: insulinase family protein [Oscillospiraceae bacterium]|nr:insulinase family protein [Oscillospiraceae bacterium]